MGDTGEGEETKLCSNCKRHISTANFVMHEVHCHRNIALCQHCQEPIPKGELEIHFEENHAKIPCPKCGESVEKMQLEKHEEEQCSKRPVKCTYCEMDVAHSDLESHHDYCGTRTEACPKCGQFVMVKDLARHEDSNCSYPPPKPANENPAPTNLTNQSSNGASSFHDADDLLFGGGELNTFAFEEMKRILNATEGPHGASGLNVGEVPVQRKRPSVPVPRTRGSQTESLSRTSKDRANKKSDLNRLRERASVTSNSTLSTEEQDRLLAMHLSQDLRDSDGIDSLVRNLDKPTDFDIPDDFPNVGYMEGFDEESGDTTMLPCEFCGITLPSDQLVMHQSQCMEDPFSSLAPHAASTANNTMPEDNRHSNISNITRPARAAPHVIDNLRNSAPAEWSTEDWDATSGEELLPCEFCDELFPQDMLVQHQAVCDRNTFMTPRVMSPAVARNSATRKPPKPVNSSARTKRYNQPSVDIGTILSNKTSDKDRASGAARGTHSYELDSTLRKYGAGSFDPYGDRLQRRMAREGTFDIDDDTENHSPRQTGAKKSTPRSKSATKPRETLNRLLHDDNINIASPSHDFQGHIPSSNSSRRNSKDNTRSRPTGMPTSVHKASNVPKGATNNIRTSMNARSVQRELHSDDQDDRLLFSPTGSSTNRRSAGDYRPTGKPTARPPSDRSSGSVRGQGQERNGLDPHASRQRGRTGNQIFDFRSGESSKTSRSTRGRP